MPMAQAEEPEEVAHETPWADTLVQDQRHLLVRTLVKSRLQDQVAQQSIAEPERYR
jgi:hypothetical protein